MQLCTLSVKFMQTALYIEFKLNLDTHDTTRNATAALPIINRTATKLFFVS